MTKAQDGEEIVEHPNHFLVYLYDENGAPIGLQYRNKTYEKYDFDTYYELFLLEFSTGMRRCEILGLKWSDLNLSGGSLRIAREVVPAGGKNVIQPPKTKNSIRTVVLPPYMVAILADMKKSKTCEWMFPSPVKEGEPRNPTAIHRRFKLILERSGCKNIRIHDLRHTFATMALENGMGVKTLSDMTGHISAETTLNIYSHITVNTAP